MYKQFITKIAQELLTFENKEESKKISRNKNKVKLSGKNLHKLVSLDGNMSDIFTSGLRFSAKQALTTFMHLHLYQGGTP